MGVFIPSCSSGRIVIGVVVGIPVGLLIQNDSFIFISNRTIYQS
jgi:hypothetical protein